MGGGPGRGRSSGGKTHRRCVRSASTALSPPKANELERAHSTWAARARWVMMSRSHSGSGSMKLAVGGSRPWCKAMTVATASSAPAAPRAWPCMDLVELTASRSACAPNTSRMARMLTGSQRSEEHTSELQSLAYLVCRLLLAKKKLAVPIKGPKHDHISLVE